MADRDPQVGIVKIVVEIGDAQRVVGFATFHARDFNGDPWDAYHLGLNLKDAYEKAAAQFEETRDAYAWEGIAGLVDTEVPNVRRPEEERSKE